MRRFFVTLAVVSGLCQAKAAIEISPMESRLGNLRTFLQSDVNRSMQSQLAELTAPHQGSIAELLPVEKESRLDDLSSLFTGTAVPTRGLSDFSFFRENSTNWLDGARAGLLSKVNEPPKTVGQQLAEKWGYSPLDNIQLYLFAVNQLSANQLKYAIDMPALLAPFEESLGFDWPQTPTESLIERNILARELFSGNHPEPSAWTKFIRKIFGGIGAPGDLGAGNEFLLRDPTLD